VRDWRWFRPPDGSIPTLPVPDLEGVGSVHLIGVGGAGMRNLARLLAARALIVTGSDLKDSDGVRELRRLGVDARIGHDAANVGSADVVIVSSAIAQSNAELVEARRRAIPVWKRQQAIAALASGRRSISIAGTHGKTTTTSMIATVLARAGVEPSFLIGGDLNESGSGARHGTGDVFVFEADESDGSFLLSPPSIGVITNVDVDHVDFYPGGLDEIVGAFAEFAVRCEQVVAWGDDPDVRRALRLAGVRAVTYGGPGSDLVVTVDELGPDGARGRFRWNADASEEVTIAMAVDGEHNLLNAGAALAACRIIGVDVAAAGSALTGFAGVHRRFEKRGAARGAEFFDDYGHNPPEMAVTIDTARRRRPRRLVAVVQPHRYSRVQAMWRELGASVVGADVVIVTDVYGAAQDPVPGVSGKLVVDGVQLAAPGTRTVYLPHRKDVVTFLDREVREGDLIVTMGCGDVWMLGDAALERIRETDGTG
jgi:UDP-N-acetylmuramate--alanine ligase